VKGFLLSALVVALIALALLVFWFAPNWSSPCSDNRYDHCDTPSGPGPGNGR
jgi:hypothetical protein